MSTNIVSINSQTATAQKIRSIVNGDQQCLPFVCFGGKKLSQPIRYTLEVTSTKPFTLTVYFHDVKTSKDDQGKQLQEITKIDIMTIQAGIGQLKVSKSDLPLSKSLVFKSIVDSVEHDYVFHSDVIVDLALPYWIDNAVQNVELNRISPMWLVISQLFLNANIDSSDNSIESIDKVVSFTERDWYTALQLSIEQLPNNSKLASLVIPDKYRIKTVQLDDETLAYEKFRNMLFDCNSAEQLDKVLKMMSPIDKSKNDSLIKQTAERVKEINGKQPATV